MPERIFLEYLLKFLRKKTSIGLHVILKTDLLQVFHFCSLLFSNIQWMEPLCGRSSLSVKSWLRLMLCQNKETKKQSSQIRRWHGQNIAGQFLNHYTHMLDQLSDSETLFSIWLPIFGRAWSPPPEQISCKKRDLSSHTLLPAGPLLSGSGSTILSAAY